MTQLHYPDGYELKGVFLLDAQNLQELDGVLAEAKKELRQNSKIALRSAVAKRLESVTDFGLSQEEFEKKKERIENDAKNSYPFSARKCEVLIQCNSGREIKGPTFAGVLSSDSLQNEWPNNATVRIDEGGTTLDVKLFGLFSSSVKVSVKPSDRAFSGRVIKLISDWAEPKRRVPLWFEYRVPLFFIGLMLLAFSPLFMPLGFITRDSGERQLLIEGAKELSVDGISDKEVPKAVDILLRLSTGNYEGTKIVGFRWWILIVPAVALSLMLSSVLCPGSLLGIGKAQWRLSWYRGIVAGAKTIVTMWIAGILISVIGSWVFELLKGLNLGSD